MRPNAGRAATARLAASVAVLFAAVLPAAAGDRALADFIGFSENGRYFAFEEYGIQDGSGFPYASIYIIDLHRDRWVAGTPYRAVLDDEGTELADARAEVRGNAAAKLDELAITQPAHLVALNGDGEPGDALALRVGQPGPLPAELGAEYRLELEIFAATSPEPCSDYLGEPPKGYALLLRSGGGSVRDLHRDAGSIPRSRGCPTSYRIYGVVTPFHGEIESGVAIVSVYPFGFEGPDRRFLAVPMAPR